MSSAPIAQSVVVPDDEDHAGFPGGMAPLTETQEAELDARPSKNPDFRSPPWNGSEIAPEDCDEHGPRKRVPLIAGPACPPRA